MSKATLRPGPFEADAESNPWFSGFDIVFPEGGIAGTAYYDVGEDAASVEAAKRTARLWAAAPNLLAVCEALHVRLFDEQCGRDDSPWATPLLLLADAIRKATGEGP
jgi:hypothetical protein